MTAVIDGYCHCGISKYQPLPVVQELLAALRVERAVLVQHLGEFDNRYLESVVRELPTTFCAVALVDPCAPDWHEQLSQLASGGRFRGLRIPRETLLEHPALPKAAADLGLVLVIDASAGVSECLRALHALLDHGLARLQISHLGYPLITEGNVRDRRDLLQLADCENVYVALSGQSMWLSYPYAPLRDFIHAVIEHFGPHRLVWGSNFPVCGGIQSAYDDLQLVLAGGWGLTPSEVELVTHANAERLWFR